MDVQQEALGQVITLLHERPGAIRGLTPYAILMSDYNNVSREIHDKYLPQAVGSESYAYGSRWVNPELVHPDHKHLISYNKHINIAMVLAHPTIWDWEVVTRNAAIKPQDVLDNPQLPWVYRVWSANPNVDWNFIQSHPHIPWDYNYAVENPNIPLQVFVDNTRLFTDANWNFYLIGCAWRDNVAHPYLERDLSHINVHKYPKATPACYDIMISRGWRDVLANPHLPWGEYINYLTDITPEIVFANPQYKWDWNHLQCNPHFAIELEVIQAHPEIKWDWSRIVVNSAITLSDIINNPQYPWPKEKFSQNINADWWIILHNPQYPWSDQYVTRKSRRCYYGSDLHRKKLAHKITRAIFAELVAATHSMVTRLQVAACFSSKGHIA